MIVSAPERAFASWIAARKVQTPLPAAVSHLPSPGLTSATSDGLLTVKVGGLAAMAPGTTNAILVTSTDALTNTTQMQYRATQPLFFMAYAWSEGTGVAQPEAVAVSS